MIRLATPEDAEGMLTIYAPFVTRSAVTFEETVPSISQFEDRIAARLERTPWLACVRDNMLIGYAYAGQYRDREAYRWATEVSVYVHPEHRRSRVGTALYGALLPALCLLHYQTAIASITLPNAASVAMHEACGFTRSGTQEKIGFKLGSWHDVGWWQTPLGEYHLPKEPSLLPTIIGSSAFQGALDTGNLTLR